MLQTTMIKAGKPDLTQSNAAQASDCDITSVLSVLEQQLAVLDRIGPTIAAAHLDSAIQQLRVDLAKRSFGNQTDSAA